MRCVERMNIFNGRVENTARVDRVDDRFDGLTVRSCRAHRDEAGEHPMQRFPLNVPLPAPGKTRHALRVENERQVVLRVWEQAHHAIPANSFQGPRWRRSGLLQGFGTHLLIDHLDRIVACGDARARAALARRAVFFSVPA